MKKTFIIILIILVSFVCFSSERAVNINNQTTFNSKAIVNADQDNTNNINKILVAYPGNKELVVYKDLFFGLTIAFGVAAFTFLSAAIAITVTYGVSNKLIREATTAYTRNTWSDAQTGLLGGTIATWSLFTVFAICGTAMGIIYMMAVPSNFAMNKVGKTRLGLKSTLKDVSLLVSYTF